MAQKEPVLIQLDEAKRWLRKHLAGVRQSISPVRRDKLSQKIVQNLVNLPEYKKAKTVAVFIGFGSEVVTQGLIEDCWRRKKNVLLPITRLGFQNPFFALFRRNDSLIKTKKGPMELVEHKKAIKMNSVQLVIVPGLGFDARGYRLGYGGGVYDRLLEKTPKAKHIGLFFQEQMVKKIPKNKQDRPLSGVVTENGYFSTRIDRNKLAKKSH